MLALRHTDQVEELQLQVATVQKRAVGIFGCELQMGELLVLAVFLP
jgi:hypothetical protein